MFLRGCAILALIWAFLVVPLRAGLTYTIQDLGTLAGSSSDGYAVNSNGVVVGASWTSGDTERDAFVTGANGAPPLRTLGTLGGTQASAQAINANGVAAGVSSLSGDTTYRAWISNGGALVSLGTLGGESSYGYAINGAGQVAGYSLTSGNGGYRAFLSDANGGALHSLGVLIGGTSSFAFGVNASGQVIGYSGTANGYNHAFISDTNGGVLHDLGTLGGSTSFATAVNDAGQVVGRSSTSNSTQHAFRSAPNGGALLDLGSLGGSGSFAQAINSSGTVVGYSYLSDNSTQHAFVYTTASGMTDLNMLLPAGSGWILNIARGINDLGQITGSGLIGGYTHAYLLTPVFPTLRVTAITRLSNYHIIVIGLGTPLKTYDVEATSDLRVPFAKIGSATATNNGSVQYEDADAPEFALRFYRFTDP